jgi:hypothetical protein
MFLYLSFSPSTSTSPSPSPSLPLPLSPFTSTSTSIYLSLSYFSLSRFSLYLLLPLSPLIVSHFSLFSLSFQVDEDKVFFSGVGGTDNKLHEVTLEFFGKLNTEVS